MSTPVSARGRPTRPFVDVLLQVASSIDDLRFASMNSCSLDLGIATRPNRSVRRCHAFRTRENSLVVADAGTRGKSSVGIPHARQYPCPLKLGSIGLPQSQRRPNPVGDARSMYSIRQYRNIPNVSRALVETNTILREPG